MSGLLWINDRDVSELGVIVGPDATGHRDGPQVTPQGQPILGRFGQVQVSDRTTAAPRVISLVSAQTAADVAALRAALDELKLLCMAGVVRVRVGDQPDREWEAIGSVRVAPWGDWLNQVGHAVTLSFTALDPVAESVTPDHVGFAAAATECPLGSAIVQPLIRLGGVTNPVVTLRDHLGRSQGTMGLTATLSASEWLEVDCEAKTITDQDGVQQAPVLTSGDFIELDPRLGAGLSGPYPTLECSGSPAIAEAIYRRRWL